MNQAEEIAQTNLARETIISAPHIKSQILDLAAYVYVQKGNIKQALMYSVEAIQLRNEIGGIKFVARNRLMAGLVHTLIGNYQEAESYFSDAVHKSCNVSEEYLLAASYLNRARLFLRQNKIENAERDVRHGFEIMIKKGYQDLYDFFPEAQSEVLQFAISQNIEVEFTRKLLRKNLHLDVTDKGELLPLLDITTLGTLSICLNGKQVLAAHQLTPRQREFFAQLLSSPQQKLLLTDVQLALWPESNEDKARSNFDNLISRLRKIIANAIYPQKNQQYLQVAKGMVRLRYCRIDAEKFDSYARTGIRHFKRQDYWQANNAFNIAFTEWEGEFLEGSYLGETAAQYQDYLVSLYVQSAEQWTKVLCKLGQEKKAMKVLENALLYSAYNERIVLELYNLYSKTNMSINAFNLLKNFEKFLEREGYSHCETRKVLDSLWAK